MTALPRHLLLLAALPAAILLRPSAGAHAQTPPPVRPPAPEVLVVGDSLGVGMRPVLAGLLPDRHVTWSVRSGITTPQGMARLRGGLRFVQPQTVVISLGTNDGPDPRRFADRIARTLAAVPPGACVVWATIRRAPRKGAYRSLNRVLRAAAEGDSRLTVVDWARRADLGLVRLPDGIHPDAAGFERRAALYAAAVQRGCAPA